MSTASTDANSACNDAALLARFVRADDHEAFATLVRRYQSLVWGTCSRALFRPEDVEDAAQVTYLTLAKHASQIRGANCGPWLYRVALRAAHRIRLQRTETSRSESVVVTEHDDNPVLSEIEHREQQLTLDQEIDALPDSYRAAFVLCCVQGLSRDDAATELDVTVNSVKSRLERARHLLRVRLLRRGITLGVLSSLLAEIAHGSGPPPKVADRLATCWQSDPFDPTSFEFEYLSDRLLQSKEPIMSWVTSPAPRWIAATVVVAMAVVFWKSEPPANAGGAGETPGQNAGLGTGIGTTSQPIRTNVPYAPSTQVVRLQAASGGDEATGSYAPANGGGEGVAKTGSGVAVRRIPNGTWKRQSLVGEATITIDGNRIAISAQGSGELALIRPVVRGEFSVASDGTVYGLFHSLDLGIQGAASSEMGELAAFGGLSDLPFSMRVYSDSEVFAIKDFNIGIPLSNPMLAEAAGDGIGQLAMYARIALTGQYAAAR